MRILGDAAKVAVAATMLLRIEPWLNSTLKLPSLVAYIIAAAVSALAVSAIASVLFARPKFAVEFIDEATGQPSAGPSIELRVDDSKEIAAYQVKVKTSATYWLANKVLQTIGSGKSKLRISLHPQDAVLITPEYGSASVVVDSNAITFDLNGSRLPGVWGSQVVALERGAGFTPVIEVRVDCELIAAKAWQRIASKIAHIDMPVRSLSLRQIRRK